MDIGSLHMAVFNRKQKPGEIMTQMFGKYRGMVRGHELGPPRLGRLQVIVPAVLGSVEVWAMPCVPYAGKQLGWFCLPPVGSSIWVEFEGGDVNLPIWTGCFWEVGELPAEATSSSTLVFKTNTIRLTVNDAADGSVT